MDAHDILEGYTTKDRQLVFFRMNATLTGRPHRLQAANVLKAAIQASATPALIPTALLRKANLQEAIRRMQITRPNASDPLNDMLDELANCEIRVGEHKQFALLTETYPQLKVLQRRARVIEAQKGLLNGEVALPQNLLFAGC